MKYWVIALSGATLAGCMSASQDAVIRDRQLDYQAAYVEPTLTVPDELSDQRITESLPIPGVEEPTAGLYGGSFRAPRADAVFRTVSLPAIRRYQVEDLQWLAVPDTPSAVYLEVRNFIESNQLQVVNSEQIPGMQAIESSAFTGMGLTNRESFTQNFPVELGELAVRFTVRPGLRANTSEVQVEPAIGFFDRERAGQVLDAFQQFLEKNQDQPRAVSRALANIEVEPRMRLERVESLDRLVIDASIPRVFVVVTDALRELGAAVDNGDLAQGQLNIRYVRKATERRLAAMSFINRALAASIDEPVGTYRVELATEGVGLRLSVVPVSGAASIGGANELVRALQERLY